MEQTQELYTAKYLNPGKDHNFEKIPDILDHLTFIVKNKKGQYERKRLSVYAKEVYRIIKKSAGNSVCWRTTEALAYEANCSTYSVCQAKKELSQSFEQLDGNSLIIIEEKIRKRFDEKGKCNGTTIKHIIGIENIWKWNNAFCSNFKNMEKKKLGVMEEKEAERAIEMMRQAFEQKSFHNYEANLPHKSANEADLPHKRPPQKADLPHKRNKHTSPLTYPHVEETNPTGSAGADPVQVCLLKEENVKQCLEAEYKLVDWLIRMGFNEKMVSNICHFGAENIYLNARYVLKMHLKKPKENLLGYFYNSLTNKWFLKADYV